MKQKGVGVSVITRPANVFQGRSAETVQAAIDALQSMGATVIQKEGIHQKHAVIDGRIAWYGSINLLSFGASQESMMRLVSGSVARALEVL